MSPGWTYRKWCAKGDLNPHALAYAPQAYVSTNSTIRAFKKTKAIKAEAVSGVKSCITKLMNCPVRKLSIKSKHGLVV